MRYLFVLWLPYAFLFQCIPNCQFANEPVSKGIPNSKKLKNGDPLEDE